MTSSPADNPACSLCGRAGLRLTAHHLIPRTRHKNKRVRREHDRARREQTIPLCTACHAHVHTTLSEKELADDFNTRERLLAHPEIHRFAAWVRTKRGSLRVRKAKRARN